MDNDIQDLYADISACLLAITNALSRKGLLTKQELSEAFQERLLQMQPEGKPTAASPHPFLLLREFAVALQTSRPE